MADNDVLADGKTLSLDDIGGVLVQRVKLQIGADGAAVDVEPPDAEDKAASKVLPAGALLWDTSTLAWRRARNASSITDATSGQGAAAALQMLFNGTTIDRRRGNYEGTLLASSARTADAVSANQTNYNGCGVIVYLNVTVASGTGGLHVIIQGIDPISGTEIYLTVSPAAITATGLYGYELSRGGSSAAPGAGAGNLVVRSGGSLPRTWRVRVSTSDASSYTYSLGYSVIN